MIARALRAGLVWPTLLSLAGLAILIGLGTWQLQRKAEKEALIATIEARRTGEAKPVADVADGDLKAADYQRVTATGRFVPDIVRFYYAPQPNLGPGYDIYQPFRFAAGRVVWVNRGFVPERLREDKAAWMAPSDEVTLTGNARRPAEPGAFTPENNPAGNVWYWRDLAGMHRSAFADGDGPEAAPFFLVVEPETKLGDIAKAKLTDGPWPRPGVSDLVIVNRHLEYALTWYGLAVTLLGVYVAYAVTRLRAQR